MIISVTPKNNFQNHIYEENYHFIYRSFIVIALDGTNRFVQ